MHIRIKHGTIYWHISRVGHNKSWRIKMKGLVIFIGIIIWILLFCLVFFGGRWILESSRKHSLKKWKMEERDYEYEKWQYSFYVIAFFVGIPLLLGIALWQEFN